MTDFQLEEVEELLNQGESMAGIAFLGTILKRTLLTRAASRLVPRSSIVIMESQNGCRSTMACRCVRCSSVLTNNTSPPGVMGGFDFGR